MRETENGRYFDQMRNGLIWMSNEFHIAYQDILLKCFWDSININCSDAFLNHVTDVAECFTFNPGDGMAQYIKSTMSGKTSLKTLSSLHYSLPNYFQVLA